MILLPIWYQLNASYCYLLYSIDATEDDSSLGRLVNDDHINPNSKMIRLIVNNRPHLCLFSTQSICKGEEITYSYDGEDLPWRSQVCMLFFLFLGVHLSFHALFEFQTSLACLTCDMCHKWHVWHCSCLLILGIFLFWVFGVCFPWYTYYLIILFFVGIDVYICMLWCKCGVCALLLSDVRVVR